MVNFLSYWSFYFGYNIKFFFFFFSFWLNFIISYSYFFLIFFFFWRIYNFKIESEKKNFDYLKFFIKRKRVNKVAKNYYEKKNIKSFSRLGVYIKNFIHQKEFFEKEINSYFIITRFSRKNLFLTLLDPTGKVLCKGSVGESGFKKKVKRTGYAIKKTVRYFNKKILRDFLNILCITRNNCNIKIADIKSLSFNKIFNIDNNIKIHNNKRIRKKKNKKK